MPHIATGSLRLPFGGRSPRAKRTSLQGARVAVTRAGSQSARMLVTYFTAGALTDLEMAERLGLPESRISARRNGLIDRHLVRYVEDVMGPFGAENGKYGLTGCGQDVARELAQATV